LKMSHQVQFSRMAIGNRMTGIPETTQGMAV
jgi:hypothetical protein